MRAAGDLFAIASHFPFPRRAVLERLDMEPLPAIPDGSVHIRLESTPRRVSAGQHFAVSIHVRNNTTSGFRSRPPHPIHLSYHWMSGPDCIIYDGERTELIPSLEAGDEHVYQMTVVAPVSRGIMRLRGTLVQEFVRWFDEPPVLVWDEATILIET
jgi:hypothetical protein